MSQVWKLWIQSQLAINYSVFGYQLFSLMANLDSLKMKVFAKFSSVHWLFPSMAGSPWPSAVGFALVEPEEAAA